MAKTTRRFIPRLEAFDDRCVPAVLVDLTGTTLNIIGKAQAESVVINDNGTDGASNVVVLVNGVEQTYEIDPLNGEDGSIRLINVSMSGGADSVTYNLTGDLAVSRSVNVNLGNKADTFTANLSGHNQLPGTDFLVHAIGGAGADVLTVNADGFSINGLDEDSPVISPAVTAQARFALFGGRGDDQLSVNATPESPIDVGKNSDLYFDLYGEDGTNLLSWTTNVTLYDDELNPFVDGTFTVKHD